MRIRIMSPILGLAIGLAALPVVACELHQSHAAGRSTVTAFLANQGMAATPVERLQRAACQADGAACKLNSDCCSGSCRPMAEGVACAGK